MGAFEKTYTAVEQANFEKAYGQNGINYYTDTTAYTGLWYAIKAEGSADAVFTTLTTADGTSLASSTLLAGDVIYGKFTAITLTSGKVIAYKANK